MRGENIQIGELYLLKINQGYLVKTLYYKLQVYDMALEKHLYKLPLRS